MKGEEDFFKLYHKLPLAERQNTVVVLDNEPITWFLAHKEIVNKTDKGYKILKILKELGIL